MSDLPANPGDPDEVSELFSRFIDQRLDEEGHRRLEELLRQDPSARERCARRLLFEADLKDAIDPAELEWLETRRVVMGRTAMEIQRSQELRVGPVGKAAPPPPAKRRLHPRALIGALVIVAALLAAALLRSRPEAAAAIPVLGNSGFETSDLSLSATGNTYSLIDWQDYFSTRNADLCEIARVTGGRILAKSGRNVARLRNGGYLTQRLRDDQGDPIIARPGARYHLSGWIHTDGTGPHVLRTALRVVASGWPAMMQYEAVHQSLEIPAKPGWQPFRIELDLGKDLERLPSDNINAEQPQLDLKGRELTLSIDSRGGWESIFYLDDLSLEADPAGEP